MTTQEIIVKSNFIKNDFIGENYLYSNAFTVLINQLTILAQENNGELPTEFLLSDNKNIFINFESISKLFELLNLNTTINNNVTGYIIINENIARTIYIEQFYLLYYIKLIDN